MQYVKRLPRCEAHDWTGGYESKQAVFRVAGWGGDPPGGYSVDREGELEFLTRSGQRVLVPIDHFLVAETGFPPRYRGETEYKVMSREEFAQDWERDTRGVA